MRLAFSENKQFIFFVHKDAKEYKFLHDFPAFIRQGPYFAIPAKINVLHNVVQRLRKARKELNLDKDVYEFLQTPFKLREIPASFKFHTQPMDYQLLALRYLYTTGSGGLLLDPGMGKSKVVLDYIALQGFKRSLIICPKALLFVWEDEIQVHRPELAEGAYVVKTTSWEDEKEGILNSPVVILNYNKAVSFAAELSNAGFDFMHIDEFLIKDPSTDRTKALTSISKRIPYRCGGSGTLINNTVLDVFSPVRYLEPSLVGWNFTNFKNKHTVPNPNDVKQVVAFKGLDEARSILESCSIVMSKERWLKLPEKVFHDVSVSLSQEQKDVYWALMRNYTAEVGGHTVDIDNPLVMLAKLYQISNGFLYINKKESESANEVSELLAEEGKQTKTRSKRETYFFNEQAKIGALRRILTERIPDRKAIIWFNMEAEYQLIKQLLDELGSKYLTIKGGEKSTGEKVREFNRTPEIQWLVCQAKSVNYGITVLGTSSEKLEELDIEAMPGVSPEVYTQVFYSMNFSLEVFLQQQDRIHRLGQKHTCEYYRIFASTPVEARIRDALSDKMTLRKDMLVDIINKLKESDNP